MEITYLPQVGFADGDSEEWKWNLPDELNRQILAKLGPYSRVKYFFASPTDD